MLYIQSLDEGIEIFKALGSELRVSIVKHLLLNDGMTMKDLAASLHITNGALTSHVKKLEEAGIIKITNESTKHGNTKKCIVYVERILIDVQPDNVLDNVYETEIQIGHYSDYKVLPTCGLATEHSIIGEVDDPKYFDHPNRYESQILWFTQGYIDYSIPNFIPNGQKIDQITLSAELSSEAPGSNDNWPSDIYISINGKLIGIWTSPGDFGNVRGIFTPKWWESNWNQYGLLKQIVLNKKGTFVDALKISDVTIDELNLDYRSNIKLRLEVPSTAQHVGGLTIYGKNFGNYNQNIQVRLKYSPIIKSL